MCIPGPGGAGLINQGPPSVSEGQGARGPLPLPLKLLEHHSPSSSGRFLKQDIYPRASYLLPAKTWLAKGHGAFHWASNPKDSPYLPEGKMLQTSIFPSGVCRFYPYGCLFSFTKWIMLILMNKKRLQGHLLLATQKSIAQLVLTTCYVPNSVFFFLSFSLIFFPFSLLCYHLFLLFPLESTGG